MTATPILMAGSDLDVVNGARASLNVEHTTLTSADEGLIYRLVADGHTEPLRGVWAKFHVVCSIGCARQIMTTKRYMAISERSTRYSKFQDEFVMPPLKRQVGKAMDYQFEPLPPSERERLTGIVSQSYAQSYRAYQDLLLNHVSKEDARSVLPIGLQTTLIWSGDLMGWLRTLARRTDLHAQDEIKSIANEIEGHLRTIVPVTLAAWGAAGRRVL